MALGALRQLFTQGPQIGDLSASELWMLHVIENCGRKGVRAATTTLSHFLNQTKSAVSQTLNALESKGYIVRSIDPGNRRQTRIEVTPLGRQMEVDFHQWMYQFTASVLERLGDEDAERYVELTERCVTAIREIKDRKSETI